MKNAPFFKAITFAFAVFGLAAASKAVDFHVSTAQGFQNALTAAQGNGANNNIWLTNGYYTGNFSYNSSSANTITVLAELEFDERAGGD